MLSAEGTLAAPMAGPQKPTAVAAGEACIRADTVVAGSVVADQVVAVFVVSRRGV